MAKRSKKNENRRRRNTVTVARSKKDTADNSSYPIKNKYNRRPKHKRPWDNQDLEDENDYEE